MKTFRNNRKYLSHKHLLNAWNDETLAGFIVSQQQRSSRRKFLNQSLLALGSVSIAPVILAETKAKKINTKTLNKKSWSQPWLTLSQVQNHLFPTSGKVKADNYSPGANDFNATGYLKLMLSVPGADKTERDFIIKGVSWLDGMANSMFGQAFIKLDKNKRERVLRKISKSKSGESWISTLLNYTFEALLTDPVYGGNTQQSGWKWLQHQAGFPRPPADKRYWLLRGRKENNLSHFQKNRKGAA